MENNQQACLRNQSDSLIVIASAFPAGSALPPDSVEAPPSPGPALAVPVVALRMTSELLLMSRFPDDVYGAAYRHRMFGFGLTDVQVLELYEREKALFAEHEQLYRIQRAPYWSSRAMLPLNSTWKRRPHAPHLTLSELVIVTKNAVDASDALRGAIRYPEDFLRVLDFVAPPSGQFGYYKLTFLRRTMELGWAPEVSKNYYMHDLGIMKAAKRRK